MNLNYKQTCRLFAWANFNKSETANVPDFWEDAITSELYSDTEYANMLNWFMQCINAYTQGNLYGATITNQPFQILSGISSDSNPPQR